MDRLSAILPRVLREKGLTDASLTDLVLKTAAQCIQSELPDHADCLEPTLFEHGVLTVKAQNSMALASCDAKAATLIRAVRALQWGISIADVRVVMARS